MSNYVSIIIDNNVLADFTQLQNSYDIFSKLKVLFNVIYIPMEIKNEYEKQSIREPRRTVVLNQLSSNKGFFRLCTRYDIIAFSMLSTTKGIDKGEAEAAAQIKTINARFILSDDRRFKEAINSIDKTIKIISSLHIVAYIELQKLDNNTIRLKQELFKIRRFSSADLKRAYIDVSSTLGVLYDKRKISKATSIMQLGL